MENNIDRMLKFDPFDAAEKMTGKDYKNDSGTTGLGFFLNFMNNQKIKEQMMRMGDTYRSIKWKDFVKLLLNHPLFNFEIAFENDFNGSYGKEKEIIFCERKRGIFIFSETFCGEDVNQFVAYFQIRFKKDDGKDVFDYFDGCSYERVNTELPHEPEQENIIFANYAHEDALLYKLQTFDLDPRCEWNVPWKQKEYGLFLWFLNYSEKTNRGDDYKVITNNKISQMKKEFADIINLK